MDRAKKWIFHWIFGIFWPESPGGPSDDLGRSFGIILSPKFQNPTIFVNHFHICFKKKSKKNHENQTFRESLESQGPRDLPSMKERKISYKMHGSRAPYDQMAPQLCLFYVPGQPSKKTLFEKPWSDGEEITTGKTGTTFCIRSGHKINWSLAFEALPVFPVVTIRHISRDKGQKAGPQLSDFGLQRCRPVQNDLP